VGPDLKGWGGRERGEKKGKTPRHRTDDDPYFPLALDAGKKKEVREGRRTLWSLGNKGKEQKASTSFSDSRVPTGKGNKIEMAVRMVKRPEKREWKRKTFPCRPC